jgi:cell division protein FtsQ
LQQVGTASFASAIAIDASRLPALVPIRRRHLVNVGHIWVLHRRRVIRIAAALMVLAGVGTIYQLRDKLAAEAGVIYDLGLREVAKSQFGVRRISITGQVMTAEKDIIAALNITPESSMFNFDADDARTALLALPAISGATVRKGYPDQLFVTLTERVPVARWRVDGVTYVIDGMGVKLNADGADYPGLPLVVGDDANDDAMAMVKAMDQFPALKQGLAALSRIGDRRWDMIYTTGLRVQLPEQGVAQALSQLTTLEAQFKVLERDVTVVDLRVPNVVAVKPSDDAAKQLDAISKANMAKNKGSFKQDADYAAPAGR